MCFFVSRVLSIFACADALELVLLVLVVVLLLLRFDAVCNPGARLWFDAERNGVETVARNAVVCRGGAHTNSLHVGVL